MRRALAVLAGAAAAVALAAGPAAAHDEIVSTSPTDAATLDVAPAQVVLTFAEPAIALGTQVLVTGPDGAVVSQGSAVLDGPTVVQQLVPSRSAGSYRVEWRVTSADGHPVTGSFTFTATSAVPVGTGAEAPTTPGSTPPPATATTAPVSPSTAPGVTGDAPRATPSQSALAVPPAATPASSTRPAVLGGILALAVLALVVARIGRARSVRRLAAGHDAGASAPHGGDAEGPGPRGDHAGGPGPQGDDAEGPGPQGDDTPRGDDAGPAGGA